MQSMIHEEDEDQLCALLKVLRTSLKTLSPHVLVTKPQDGLGTGLACPTPRGCSGL